MTVGPWPASTLLSVARDRGWLDWPRRLALLRTGLRGGPGDWESFATDYRSEYRPLVDFAACPNDHEWRLLFARYLLDNMARRWELETVVQTRQESPPEDWRILQLLTRDEEREIDTAAIRAAFPDVPADRLDDWLAVMSEDLRLIEEVPAARSDGTGGGRRWRVCDPWLRFWHDELRRFTSNGARFLRGEGGLAERLRVLEKDALARLKRDCGADWPEPPDRGPGQAGWRIRPLPRKACPGLRSGAAPVERRACAFAVTAPGVLEGVLVPYGVPIRIAGALDPREPAPSARGPGQASPDPEDQGFEEVFEPGSLTVNGLLVNVPQPVPDPRGRPLARPGKGLELDDGPDAMRATLTLPDTIDGRRVRARVEAGELTAFSAAFQALEEEWPATNRRIVRRALLVGLALADRPEHESPLVDGVCVQPEAG